MWNSNLILDILLDMNPTLDGIGTRISGTNLQGINLNVIFLWLFVSEQSIVTAGSRTGQNYPEKAYNGTSDRHFFMTPIEFFGKYMELLIHTNAVIFFKTQHMNFQWPFIYLIEQFSQFLRVLSDHTMGEDNG